MTKIFMKEIDFLPEWYKNGRRRQFSYRTQYLALGGMLLVMVVWNLLGLHTISKAKAQIHRNVTEVKQAENISTKLADMQSQISRINNKQAVIYKTDSKINLANTLAELSCLVSDKIVFGKVEIIPERFEELQGSNSTSQGTAVRAARSDTGLKQQTLSGDVRFRIVITGVAANAIEVADLIRQLEESQYFSGVVLSYSRNAPIQVQGSSYAASQSALDSSDVSRHSEQKVAIPDIQVSRFEISCYLANFRQL
jgi:hypothetical protein